jgi:acetyl esterase/lipase
MTSELTVETRRREYDELFGRLPVDPDAEITAVPAGPVDGLRIRFRADAPRHILFIHGGGYFSGNPEGASSVAALLARDADAEVLAPRYRLAPEHPHPAAVEDVVGVYRELLDRGVDPARLAIVGESAGGGLSLVLAVELVRLGIPPAAVVVWSPLGDLDASRAPGKTNAGQDPMCTLPVLTMLMEAYLGGRDPRMPTASPIHADLTGLPPLLIQVGEREALLDDATLLAANARAAGVDVTLEVAERQSHVFQYWSARRPEARAAITRSAEFVIRHTA